MRRRAHQIDLFMTLPPNELPLLQRTAALQLLKVLLTEVSVAAEVGRDRTGNQERDDDQNHS
jgi:hypothetical protein